MQIFNIRENNNTKIKYSVQKNNATKYVKKC